MPPPGATERLGLFEVGVATPISSSAPCHHLVRRSALACSRIVKLRAAAGFEACAAESDFESKVSFEATFWHGREQSGSVTVLSAWRVSGSCPAKGWASKTLNPPRQEAITAIAP